MPVIDVPDNKSLGEWAGPLASLTLPCAVSLCSCACQQHPQLQFAGLCKIDKDGMPRKAWQRMPSFCRPKQSVSKVVGASCVAVVDFGEEGEADSRPQTLLEGFMC